MYPGMPDRPEAPGADEPGEEGIKSDVPGNPERWTGSA